MEGSIGKFKGKQMQTSQLIGKQQYNNIFVYGVNISLIMYNENVKIGW